MDAKRIVIDSSVALKWRLKDEEATNQADELLDDFLSGALDLLTPTLFDYEIANALKVAVIKGRLSRDEAITALDDFQHYTIQRFEFRRIQIVAFRLAYQYQRSVYDSAYMALAQSEGVWFYTGETRLFNAIGNAFPRLKWIGKYQIDTVPDTYKDFIHRSPLPVSSPQQFPAATPPAPKLRNPAPIP